MFVYKMERWKQISRWEGRYEISSKGNVRNIRTDCKGWKERYKKNRDLTNCIDYKGYIRVRLGQGGVKGRLRGERGQTIKIHREVAKAFLPNPKKLPEVNHKNGIKTDNRASNLEWVSSLDNYKHAVGTGLRVKEGGLSKGKVVHQYSLGGKYIASYSSGNEAAKFLNITKSGPTQAAKRDRCSGGFRWSFKKRRILDNKNKINKV